MKGLFYRYFGAADGAPGEGADFAAGHFDRTVFGGVDGEVAAHGRAGAGTLCGADLADDNFAIFDDLAAKALDTEALALAIASVFTCTTGFDM